MPLVIADRVKETTTTTGTGTITLAGATVGYQSFAVVGTGNTTYYCIAGQNTSQWEVGIGTYTGSGTTLSRDSVLSNSSGTTSPINFSAGTKDVFITYPAGRAVIVDGLDMDTYNMGATQGDILFASATNVFSRLAKSATANRYLSSNGTNQNPSWSQVSLSSGVTGTLPIANGGSGQTTTQSAMNAFAGSVASGQYLRGNGTNVVMSNIQAADVPILNQNTSGNADTATSLLGNAIGSTFAFNSGYGSVATAYGCRAWVNFDGAAATITIRASGNVSSIGDLGVGFYRVNFSSGMPDINYAAVGTPRVNGFLGLSANISSTALFEFQTKVTSTLNLTDYATIGVAVFR